MAVLLEGINIPEGNPITINIYRDGTWVNAYTTEDGNAIEVPEPHGRLGDLDAPISLIDTRGEKVEVTVAHIIEKNQGIVKAIIPESEKT